MSLADIREQIRTILSGVAGIGVIHEYERLAVDLKKFLDLFKDPDGRVNGWQFTRISTPSDRNTMPTLHRHHLFRLRGIYGLRDEEATELTFQDMVEAIQNAFDSEYSLNGTVLNSGPVQVRVVENRMFGNVLCHYAELELIVIERKTYS